MNGNDLIALGYKPGPIIKHALEYIEQKVSSGGTADEALAELDRIRLQPQAEHHIDDLSRAIAKEWRKITYVANSQPRDEPLPFKIWGPELIDQGALDQMEHSMRLPVALGGALMPDAHVGYGLPIGGVLATENAIVPYAVGVDIACRVTMTLYEVGSGVETYIRERQAEIDRVLKQETSFGKNCGGLNRTHPVLDDPRFREIPIAKRNHQRARHQLGSSGGGNHFVDVGTVTVSPEADLRNPYGAVPPGEYLAIMTHSGSRGLGKAVCDTYVEIAQKQHPTLRAEMKNLAWLEMDSEPGQEYFEAMNLCGEYAQANHHLIHEHVAKKLGLKPVVLVENHHNFAWRETDPTGKTIYVHRKGATPAAEGQLGVIPGSMADFSYLVRGKGGAGSYASASHGAGRQLGRKAAVRSLNPKVWSRMLRDRGVTLIGGSIDESPMAYKPIDEVMARQSDLVEPIARFTPRIVLMAGEPGED